MNDIHILNIKHIKICKINNYDFTFLNEFNEYINVKHYYDILLYVNLQNLYDYLNIKWSKLNNIIDKNYTKNYTDLHILNKVKIKDIKVFENSLNTFINHNYAMSVFFINILLRFIN